MATLAAHPFSAASKQWNPPDFSRENRRPKASLTSPVSLSSFFSHHRHPDEEVGRSFRSSSQTQSTSALFGKADGEVGQEEGRASSLIQLAPSSLFPSDTEGDATEDDAFFESWRADGGAAGGEPTGSEEASTDDSAQEGAWFVPKTLPRPQPLVNWTSVLDQAVLDANGWVDLSGRGLTEVPYNVSDLSTLRSLNPRVSASTTRAFCRTQTVPASAGSIVANRSTSRSFGRTSSGSFTPASPPPSSCVPVNLILSNNDLTTGSISNALWTLPNLHTLSLRHNQLEHLPEGIGRLVSLTELNVAGNKLQYLPAEILQLENLQTLRLYPNPFLPAPTSVDLSSSTSSTSSTSTTTSEPSRRRNKRLLGPLTTHFTVPSLHETSIRRLLSAYSTTNSTRAIEYLYDKDELKRNIDPLLLEPFLSTLYPAGSSSLSSSTNSLSHIPFTRTRQASSSSSTTHLPPLTQPFDPLSHICRSPSHPDGSDRVFFKPAVERFEWVSEAALQPAGAGEEGKARSTVRCIPVRWRGCGARCLDWLEDDEEEDEEGETAEKEEAIAAADQAE
ncbi:hypothetical protein JCM11251_004249 [Rhodosporidiobolus azoricus]